MGDRRADERRAERLAARREAERRERGEQERAKARREQLRSDALARSRMNDREVERREQLRSDAIARGRMHDREVDRREQLRSDALARARKQEREAERLELQRAAALQRRRAADRDRAREETKRADASARRAGDRLTLDRTAERRQARRAQAAVRRAADARERDARAQTNRVSRPAPAKAKAEKNRPRTLASTQREPEHRREPERQRERRATERQRADTTQRDRERRRAAAKQTELERRLAERERQLAASTAAQEATQQARLRRVADWGRHVEEREAGRARRTRRIEEKREAIRSQAVSRRVKDQRQALAPPVPVLARQVRRQVEALGRRSAVPASGNPGPHVARLPSGARSGVLPWLHTRGPVLLDEHNRPFTLRGVTVRGLERAKSANGTFRAPVGQRDLASMRRWHVTALAVPIAQDLALDGDAEADAESYLAALDEVIAAAARAGLYTIVRLSLLSSTLPTAPGLIHDRFDPPLPDAGSIDLWGVLARRYSREPAVLFELFRSPHDPDPGDSTTGVMRSVDWGLWTSWLLAMLGTLRREHPRSLAIMRGLRNGTDLSGFPVPYTDGTAPANVIYAAQLTAPGPDAVLESLRSLGRRVPVAVTEVSAAPGDELRVERLGRQLAQLGAHWFAADWDSGAMLLVRRGRHGLTPTPLGRAFGAAFSVPYAIAPPRFHHFGAH